MNDFFKLGRENRERAKGRYIAYNSIIRWLCEEENKKKMKSDLGEDIYESIIDDFLEVTDLLYKFKGDKYVGSY